MMDYMASFYEPYKDSSGAIIETEVNGHPAYICSYTMSEYVEEETAEEATDEITEPAADEAAEPAAEATEPAAAEEAVPEEEHEPNTFHQNISMYIAADDSHSIGVNAYFQGSDNSFYMTDEEIEAFMLDLAKVIVFPEK